MKSNIRLISATLAIMASSILPLNFCYAAESTNSTNGNQDFLRKFSQNDIEFYNPVCQEATSEETCGNTAKEKYWTALSKTFGPVQAAGIMGNIMNEGAFNPVAVESCTSLNPFDFHTKQWSNGWTWQTYLDSNCSSEGGGYEDLCPNGGKPSGVGAFGTTYNRSEFLHHVQETAPDLLKYFEHPDLYSFGGCNGAPGLGGAATGGDALMAAIGESDFSKLVDLDVEWVLESMKTLEAQYGSSYVSVDEFNKITDPGEAAVYWSMHMERCDGCTIADGPNSQENQERRAAGAKAYDEMKDFKCSSGGIYQGQTFQLSDAELDGVVRIADHENSCNLNAIKKEISLMANLFDTRGNGKTFIQYVTTPPGSGGWFAAYSHYYDSTSVDAEKREAARDILVNGRRTMPPQVKEHDCMYNPVISPSCTDIVWVVDADGNAHTDKYTLYQHPEWFVSNKSLIHTVYQDSISPEQAKSDFAGPKTGHGYYVFYDWAGGPDEVCGDPFGYFANDPPDSASGSSSTASSGSSSSSSTSSTTQPSKITLIGDSISVMSESALKEKLGDSFLNMVGSRHVSSGGVCSGDEGGITILDKLSRGSGSIITQHSDGSCETINPDSFALNDAIVWELGTNPNGVWDYSHNKPDRTNIDKAISLIGNKRTLYLVTPYTSESAESKARADSIADMYRSIAKEKDNVEVVDWNAKVSGDEAKYIVQSDHTHPTEEGSKLLADLISQLSTTSQICSSNASDPQNFQVYYQGDPPWSGESWGGHGTIRDCGCSASAFAMIATALLGREITPSETTKAASDMGMIHTCGGDDTLVEKLADHYNLEHERLYEDVGIEKTRSQQENEEIEKKMSEYLRQGYMIEVSGNTGDRTTAPFRAINGHFLAIRGITSDGKWLIGNSAKWDTTDSFKEWDPMDIVTYMHYGVVAIRGSGTATGNANNCDNICEGSGSNDSSSGLVAGGLTLSQALALMEEYNNADEQELLNKQWIGYTPCTGGSKSNCVAFVQYFLNRYTTKAVPGLPDGRNVVSKLISEYGLIDGGETPKPYAIFSTGAGSTPCGNTLCGHTGVVLGIDAANNKIIIGEAGCSKPASWTTAREYDLDSFIGNGHTYAYTDDILKDL